MSYLTLDLGFILTPLLHLIQKLLLKPPPPLVYLSDNNAPTTI